jgi:hypothetical protein
MVKIMKSNYYLRLFSSSLVYIQPAFRRHYVCIPPRNTCRRHFLELNHNTNPAAADSFTSCINCEFCTIGVAIALKATVSVKLGQSFPCSSSTTTLNRESPTTIHPPRGQTLFAQLPSLSVTALRPPPAMPSQH